MRGKEGGNRQLYGTVRLGHTCYLGKFQGSNFRIVIFIVTIRKVLIVVGGNLVVLTVTLKIVNKVLNGMCWRGVMLFYLLC